MLSDHLLLLTNSRLAFVTLFTVSALLSSGCSESSSKNTSSLKGIPNSNSSSSSSSSSSSTTSSSSSSTSSSSTSSSTGSNSNFHTASPQGCMPGSILGCGIRLGITGGGSQILTTYESFDQVLLAVDAGSPTGSSFETGETSTLVPFIADNYFSGGVSSDRQALSLWSSADEIEPASARWVRTGDFTYEIPIGATTAFVEIHIASLLPRGAENQTSIPFTLKIEGNAYDFQFATSCLSYMDSISFQDVEITDGYLTIEANFPGSGNGAGIASIIALTKTEELPLSNCSTLMSWPGSTE